MVAALAAAACGADMSDPSQPDLSVSCRWADAPAPRAETPGEVCAAVARGWASRTGQPLRVAPAGAEADITVSLSQAGSTLNAVVTASPGLAPVGEPLGPYAATTMDADRPDVKADMLGESIARDLAQRSETR